MLYSIDKITDVKLMSSDGASADIKDVYFDDVNWVVRYFVVDIGSWVSGRRVLISPQAIREFSEERRAFLTNLTQQQILNSPASDSEQTVSRQQEERLNQYYGWSSYWTMPMGTWPGIYTYPPYSAGTAGVDRWGHDPLPSTVDKELQARLDREPESHLRSFQEVKKYGLRATDGDIGQLDDLLIEPETWRITHLIADARKWWPGGQVVIDRGLALNISWNDEKIEVAMTRDEVKNAPPYDRDEGITEAYQMSLSRYYQSFMDRTHGMPSLGATDRFEPQAHV